MNTDNRPGCLGQILAIFGIKPPKSTSTHTDLPFRMRDDFLSPAELAFYRSLVKAVGGQAIVCPKVNLADIFFVARPSENQGLRNKIDRKHVDFLLCDTKTMKPRCGIELDDSSHSRRDRVDRDAFVDQVFRAAALPLIHVPAKASYDVENLAAQIAAELHRTNTNSPTGKSDVRTSGIPNCPKCGIPMVSRVASKGHSAGRAFFGCTNFPKCREVSNLE